MVLPMHHRYRHGPTPRVIRPDSPDIIVGSSVGLVVGVEVGSRTHAAVGVVSEGVDVEAMLPRGQTCNLPSQLFWSIFALIRETTTW